MTTKSKRKTEENLNSQPSKKAKNNNISNENVIEKKVKQKSIKESKTAPTVTKLTENVDKPSNTSKNVINKKKIIKTNTYNKQNKFSKDVESKPPDWLEFKKKKQELKIKRKQNRNFYDLTVRAKQIGELLRRKKLTKGDAEREKLVKEAHNLLGGKGNYKNFVLTHDMARIVQYVLKFGSEAIREEVAKEIVPSTMEMIQSKYGKFVIRRILKYGNSKIRSSVIKAFYGNVIKLCSHSISASTFEYAISTWATNIEKQHLIQEFFGDIYKQNKDDNVKHLNDVYKNSPDMKAAALGATKSNLLKIMNKKLYDSYLVQTVLNQYLNECSIENRNEFITQLAPHIVVLSNSKYGARAAMKCIWYGTNKDRKIMMKTLKEHVIELSKHEHGHCTVIALIDATDDTVLINKIILTEILKNAKDLWINEWGRKVLLWLIAPGDSTHFHPIFIKELENGLNNSTSKKTAETRRKEILNYCSLHLLNLFSSETTFFLSTASYALIALSVLKSGSGDDFKKALIELCKVITDPEWKIQNGDSEINGIEHFGIHMVLKKLAQNDKNKSDTFPTFGATLLEIISDDVIKSWIKLNRGCFLLVAVFENGTKEVQKILKSRLKKPLKAVKNKSKGAEILVKLLNE